MLFLFTYCWESDSSIQVEVGKLNRDLLQPSGIRYKFWSFSVRYLISLSYWNISPTESPILLWREIPMAWGTYSPLLPELVLESTSLCPLEHFGVLPKLSFCLWACYRDMEDWGGGGPSGGFSFSDSQTYQQRLYSL